MTNTTEVSAVTMIGTEYHPYGYKGRLETITYRPGQTRIVPLWMADAFIARGTARPAA